MTWSLILLYLLSFLLIWQFVGYPSLMAVVALKTKPKNKNYSYQPFVSVIVPAYNEGKVIKKRIKNLFEIDYPKDNYEIIIVESGSMDNTYDIVKEIIECRNSKPDLKVLKELERKGKASAINFGKRYAKGDIILVTDANSIFDKNVLKEMMPNFENPEIGAVCGRYVVPNPDTALSSSESFYSDLESIIRRGESALDSACLFHGEINAWRKGITEADAECLSEDLDMAIKIRKRGYKIKYEPGAIVYEPSSTTLEDQIKQKKRRAIGTIQCIFKHLSYFLPPRNLYSLLIFPSHKALPMFSPFILLAIPLLYVITKNIGVIVTHFVLTIFVFVLIFGLLTSLKSKLLITKNERKKSVFFISSILNIAYYVLLNEYLIMLAWGKFISRRYSVLWEKAESTRD